jgi:hypothetical protein
MKYYIYQHIRLDNNTVFYIGKGTKKFKGNAYYRAYTKSSRNTYWLNIVNITCYKVEILEEFETEEECLLKETELIIKHGYSWNNTGTLCNIVKDDSEIKLLARNGASKKNSKEVHQYSLSGDYIQSFNSVTRAKKEFLCDIYNAAKGRVPSAGGYQWRFIKYDKIDSYSLKHSHINRSKIIYQYDKEEVFIKEWKGSKEPSEMLNINRTAIRNCLSGLVKTAGGFIWSYHKLLKTDKLKKYTVYRNNELIFSADTLKKCADYLNLNQYSVSVYLQRGKSYKGYMFYYNDVKTKNERDDKGKNRKGV